MWEQQQQQHLRQPQHFCGTSSVDKFYGPVGLVPCYPVCRLLPAYLRQPRWLHRSRAPPEGFFFFFLVVTSAFQLNSYVGRTHIIVRLQTWNRRKDQGKVRENFGGFVDVLDGFPQRDFLLWVFMYPINISLFSPVGLYHSEGYHAPPLSFPAITPGATTPVQMHSS